MKVYQILAESKTKQKIEPAKPRNFVAKNAINTGAGAHKDKKKAIKQGEVKHKKQTTMEAGYRRDAYQRDYDNSVAGMGKRQSYAYSQDGGANDEGDDAIDAKIRADYEKKKQYEVSGKFWLKQKDTQQHISDVFVGKAAANKAALDLLKQQPELKGNLLITAYGPGEKMESVAETATAGATSAGNVAVGAIYKNKSAKTPKNKDGTAKNALDMKGTNLLTGGSIKR